MTKNQEENEDHGSNGEGEPFEAGGFDFSFGESSETSSEGPVDEEDGLSIDDWMSGFGEQSPDYSLDELSQAYAQILADQDGQSDRSEDSTGETEGTPTEQTDGADEEVQDHAEANGVLTDSEDGEDIEAVEQAIAFLEPVKTIDRNVDLQQDDRITLTPERIVESILFVGTPDNSPVSGRLIASLIRGVSPNEVEQYVGKLNDTYRQDLCPYRIQKEPLGYRMVLREAFQSIRSRFYGQVREVKLSQVVVDTLAVVAFHQPINREGVENIMGRPSGGNLNQLIRRNLLSLEVRSKTEKYYRTTDRFLDLFGIETLEDLPQMDQDEE